MILLLGGAVFGASALALCGMPSLFLKLLDLAESDELIWSMRLMGVTLVTLSGNMMIVSYHASAVGVRIAGLLMQICAAGLGVMTLLIPADYNWFTLSYSIMGWVFSGAYFVQNVRAIGPQDQLLTKVLPLTRVLPSNR